MLENSLLTGRELLVVLSLALPVALYLLGRYSRRRKFATADLGARLAALEADLALLRTRLEQLEARPPVESALDTQASTYAEAMRRAREGATEQELAGHLGISRSEAELIVALQRRGT